MTPELRTEIAMGRSTHYFGIMRTVIFGFLGVAAVIEFGPDGYSAPLTMLVITLTAYGILAGGVALDDLNALRADMDDETAGTTYGKGLAERNIPGLKMISSVLVGLTGIAELFAIFT